MLIIIESHALVTSDAVVPVSPVHVLSPKKLILFKYAFKSSSPLEIFLLWEITLKQVPYLFSSKYLLMH